MTKSLLASTLAIGLMLIGHTAPGTADAAPSRLITIPFPSPIYMPPREPLMLAAATTKAEAALELTRSQRVWIQKGLNTLGFDVGAADGIFGPRTRAAIARWQAARGEAPTGHLDAEAAALLVEVGKAASPTTPKSGKAETTASVETASEASAEASEPTPPAEPAVPKEALATLDEALSTARRIDDDFHRIAQKQLEAGDSQGAAQSIAKASAATRKIGEDWRRASALGYIAQIQVKMGDMQGATRYISEAFSTAGRISDDWQRGSALSGITEAQAAVGNSQVALSAHSGESDQ